MDDKNVEMGFVNDPKLDSLQAVADEDDKLLRGEIVTEYGLNTEKDVVTIYGNSLQEGWDTSSFKNGVRFFHELLRNQMYCQFYKLFA